MTDWRHARPAPRNASGPPKPITDDVTWTQEFKPREHYRIEYIDRKDDITVREIELMRLGHSLDIPYAGVWHEGKFKTLRIDRIIKVEQLSTGHQPSLFPAPGYTTVLPAFPIANAVYREATIAASSKTWGVDLNHYRCTCPEGRERAAKGYKLGELGAICPHLARAIVRYLPTGYVDWTPELLRFLKDPRRTHINNVPAKPAPKPGMLEL